MIAKTKSGNIRITKATIAYPHLAEPDGVEGAEKKYGCTVILAKEDYEAMKTMLTAFAGSDIAKTVWGGKAPVNAVEECIRTTNKDGDDLYGGRAYIHPKTKYKPAPQAVQNAGGEPVDLNDTEEIYSGIEATVIVTPYAYKASGNKGIAFNFCALKKTADGERIGGSSIDLDFGDETQNTSPW